MADISLLNSGAVAGSYGLIPTVVTSNVVTTQLVSGLTVVKSADKEVWADATNLIYTITVTNNAGQEFSNPILTDLLDPLKIILVDGSVEINGVEAVYTYVAGLLTVELPDLAVGDDAEVTFQVQKI